jgi:hypothetical protein
VGEDVIELPNADELAEMQNALATSLIVMREQMAPAFDAADGIRADMAVRGYSPSATEEIAVQWLSNVMSIIMIPADNG